MKRSPSQKQPKRAVLTNMHIDLDFRTLSAELPDGIRPAFDGMVFTSPLPDTPAEA